MAHDRYPGSQITRFGVSGHSRAKLFGALFSRNDPKAKRPAVLAQAFVIKTL